MSPLPSPHCNHQKVHPKGSIQQFQLCTDYRKLNSLLPMATPTMGTKKGTLAFYAFTLICEVGITTLSWTKNQYQKKCFHNTIGKFEFLRLPFGLSQDPDFLFISFTSSLALTKPPIKA